jgi:hypothetical protein
MNTLENKLLAERINKLLAIPQLIDDQGRILIAQRAIKRTTERERDAREAAIRTELLTDNTYKDHCRIKEERDAYFEHVKHNDEVWGKLQRRWEQLTVAVDKSTLAKEVLDHDRKALKAALEREYARVIEETISDQTLSQMLKGAAA